MATNTVLSYFQGQTDEWSVCEQQQLKRLKNAFGQDLYDQVWEQGVTDRGEPWIAAIEAESLELVVHVARLDGAYVVLGEDLSIISAGRNLRAVVSDCVTQIDAQRREPTLSEGICLRMPSGVSLAVMSSVLIDHIQKSGLAGAVVGQNSVSAALSDWTGGLDPDLSGASTNLIPDEAASDIGPARKLALNSFLEDGSHAGKAPGHLAWPEQGSPAPGLIGARDAASDTASPAQSGASLPKAATATSAQPGDMSDAPATDQAGAASQPSGQDQTGAAADSGAGSGADSAAPPATGDGSTAPAPVAVEAILVDGLPTDDRLVSAADGTVIMSDSGDDRLSGQAGPDIFVFAAGAQDGARDRIVITDFDATEDSLLLAGGMTIQAIRHQQGDLRIRLDGDGDLLILRDADRSALAQIEFIDDLILV